MSRLPNLLVRDRVPDAVLLPLIGVAQAGVLGLGAFATRDAFEALHAGEGPTSMTLARLAGAGIVAAGLDLAARRKGEALGQSYTADLRHVLYDHIAGMDRRALEERRLGALSLRFVGDLSAARLWFGRGLPRLLSSGVVFPGAAVVLWLLDAQLALVAGGPVLVSLLVMLALAVGLRTRQERLRNQRAALSIGMMERIAMAPELDLIARTEQELRDLDSGSLELGTEAVGRVTRVGLLRLVPQVGAAVAAAGILAATARLGLAPGVAAASLAVLAILTLPMRDFAESWDEWCAWRVAREKVQTLLERPSVRRVVQARGGTVGLKLVNLRIGAVEVTAEVPPGALAVITGPKGSGKSRLAAIIAGLDRPEQGSILYGDRVMPLPRTTYIGDRPSVVQGSLRRALTMGIVPRPSGRTIKRLAENFGLADLCARQSGILSRVGEAGRTLSQGEALRVELARGALSRSDLFVIDAPRFLADPERLDLLLKLRRTGNATVVIVAPSAAEFAPDLIFDLGALLAQGEGSDED